MARAAELLPVPDASDPSPRSREVSRRTGSRRRGAIVAWTAVGCLLLGGSGVVRAIQERRFEVEKGYLETCPFPLKSLPSEVGPWKMVQGGEMTLDPLTARITGATDHIMRAYVDELTGVSLSILILFGPAEPVLPHTPQICYPATGYTPTEEPALRMIRGKNDRIYAFRSGVFAKSGGRGTLREVSYHSFRLERSWSPDVAAGRRFPRKNPGIFKVQIQRKVAEGENLKDADPIDQFIAQLMPEIDRRIEQEQATRSVGSSKDTSPADPVR